MSDFSHTPLLSSVSDCFAEVPDSQPSLKFTPYDNPMTKPSKPLSTVPPEVKHEPKAAKPLKEPKDVEINVNSRTHAKTIETAPASNKLFSGQAVWGPGGYTRDRVRSGSVESSNKSDSSSRSSGSDRQAVVKTKAEVRICVSSIFRRSLGSGFEFIFPNSDWKSSPARIRNL